MQAIIMLVNVISALSIFATIIRAMRFAGRHKDKLTTDLDKAMWWLRLLVRNGYGEEHDTERKRMVIPVVVSLAVFFGNGLFVMLNPSLW